MAHTYEHPRPAVTVDVVFLSACGDGPRILLIERARPPFRGRWALPGGFLDADERLEDAARRELCEETGVEVGTLAEVGAFGDPGRDPRGHTVSVAFLAVWPGDPPAARSGDDAARVEWRSLRRLPPLAFDHAQVVRRARGVLRERAEADRLVELMPARFTLAELAVVHAAAVGRPVAPAALGARLRRRGAIRSSGARRGRAMVYRRGATR